jgi:hypothetical protein
MSNVFNWILELPPEPTIRPGSEPELLPYYFPPRDYTFTEDRNIREIGRPLEALGTVYQIAISYISSLIAALSRGAYSIEMYNDDLYGTVVKITTDLSAKDALELWLKLIDYFPYKNYGIVLSVKWLGENNVSENELVNYMVKIMIKSKIGPKALPGFDAARMVQEAREE